MPAQAWDTQQGATIAFATDSLALRVVKIDPIEAEIVDIDITHLGTTDDRESTPGELRTWKEVQVTYQNSPALANLTIRTVQTITVTGPIPPGGSTGEIHAGTGYVKRIQSSPEYGSATEGLQMKTATIKFDGITGPTRTAAT